jgi:parallel beta-helix repeat protein
MDNIPKGSSLHLVGLLAGLGLFILVVYLISPGMVEGRTIVVPEEFPTIQQAIDNASSGDTIRLWTGKFDVADEYTSNALINVDKSITIAGNGTTRTTVMGGSVSAFWIRAPGVNLSALWIVGNGTDVGVSVNGSNGCRIEDVHITNCNISLHIEGSERVIVRNSTFSGTEYGIFLTNGTRSGDFFNVVARDSRIGLGISNELTQISCQDNFFDRCSFKNNDVGVDVHFQGIRSKFTSCTFDDNSDTGAYLRGQGHHITGSSFNDDERYCIDMYRVEDSTFDGLTFNNNRYTGFHLMLSTNNTVSNCTFVSIRYPLSLTASDNNRFTGLDIKNSYRGVHLRSSSHNTTVEDSIFYRAGESIFIGANDTRVSNCTFDRSNYAINCYGSFVDIEDCTITNIDRHGIQIIPGGWIRVSNCTIDGSDADGIYISDYSQHLEPITIENCRITNSGDHGIYLNYRGEVRIYGNHISNSERDAIVGAYGDHITILNNDITDSRYGINLAGGVGHIVGDNTVSGNEKNGLTISSTQAKGGHWVHNNTFTGNGWGEKPGAAISIRSGHFSNITIEHNLIIGNHKGIHFYGHQCANNTVRWNTIKDSVLYGISISEEVGPNVFYFNWFLNNNIHVLAVHPEDVFDDGRYGNFWDDYQERYPEAQLAGAIWDTPYEVKRPHGVFDRYPLAYLYETNPPVAKAGPDMVASYGVSFMFDGSRSTDDSAIATYVWRISLGEGEQIELLSLSPYMTFTFDRMGQFNVTFTIFDVWGSSSTDTMTLTVIDKTPPIANAGNDLWVDIGRSSHLDAGDSWDNVGITFYWWTVDPSGLDIVLFGIRPTFSIDSPGTYTVVLNVEDAAGNRGWDTMTLEVGDTMPPVADAGHDITIDQGSLALFDGTGSQDDLGILGWTWVFDIEGSNFVTMGETSQYYFLQAGYYLVTLTVEDMGGNTATDTMTVRVRDIEFPIAVPGNDLIAPQGTEVTFNGSRSSDNVGVTEYLWAFFYAGNTQSINGQVIDFIFYDLGEYEVMLTVSDAAGNQNMAAIQITVMDSTNPSAVIAMAGEADAGTRVFMDGGLSTDNVGVEVYTWTFVHDGRFQRLQGAHVSFNFTMPGEYPIRLEVADSAGNRGVDETVFIVHGDIVQDSGEGSRLWMMLITLFIGTALAVVSLKYLVRDDLESEAGRKN